jgi:hypothetical protein
MEVGGVADWYRGQDAIPESEQHSGDGECRVVGGIGREGGRALVCTAHGPGDATRMFRYAEPRSGAPLTYSAWFLVPRFIEIGPSGNWNIFQFKSKNLDEDRSDPFLSFNLRDMGNQTYTVYVYKKPEKYSIRPTEDVRLRVNEWFGIRAALVQSGESRGRLQVWILRDGRPDTLIIDVAGLTTRYPDGVGVQDWSVNNYGAQLDWPATIYIDDARIDRIQALR